MRSALGAAQRRSTVRISRTAVRRRMFPAAIVGLALAMAAIVFWPSSAVAASSCDLTATPSTFPDQVAAAVDGQTICLDEGDYGTWEGTDKRITVRPLPDTSPELSLALSTGAANFTIDGGHTGLDPTTPGIDMGPSTFTGTPGPQNITIRNVAITGDASGGVFEFDGPTESNIVLDHDVWHDVMDIDTEANVRFSYEGDSGVTIKNSLFENSLADGLKVGAQITARNNEFVNIYPWGHPE